MLTKDLLRFSRRAGAISLQFLPPTPLVLAQCAELLTLYREALAQNLTRQALEERLEPFLKSGSGGKTAAGLHKIVMDHAEFAGAGETADPVDPEAAPAARRETIFKAAAKVLVNPPADAARYRAMVAALAGGLPADLYDDLPACDRLMKVPEWTPEELRNRYNVGLVQGVLGYAQSIELAVAAATPMELRKFMRRLKFFRLLAEVTKASESKVQLALSAPGAIFSESRVYGQNLANFFPAVLLLPGWKMSTEVSLTDGGGPLKLHLAAGKCDLRSTFPRWSSYVPEEVAMFLRAFRREVPEWVEAPEAAFPKAANQGVIFPDFSFCRKDDPETIVHVELFHHWHRTQLETRLSWLTEHPSMRYVIGIDRSLISRSGEKEFLDKYQKLHDRIFFFSNYPGVEKVKQMLNCAEKAGK